MSAPLVHVSKRALEALAFGGWEPPAGYSCKTGVAACGVLLNRTVVPRPWCSVEHVRALHLQPYTRLRRVTGYTGYSTTIKEPVLHPTCPKCSVMLDEALSTAVASPHPDLFIYDPSVHTPEKLIALGFVPTNNRYRTISLVPPGRDPRDALYDARIHELRLYGLKRKVAEQWRADTRVWVDKLGPEGCAKEYASHYSRVNIQLDVQAWRAFRAALKTS